MWYLNPNPVTSHTTPTTRKCLVLMGDTYPGNTWDSAHDMIPIPHERRMMVTLDFDVHIYDIVTGNFTCCDPVADQYLRGFEAVGNRTGWNPETEEWENVNRTNLKSISLAPDGSSVLYNQAIWGKYRGEWINLLVGGVKMPNIYPGKGTVYRARWFTGTPAWPPAW